MGRSNRCCLSDISDFCAMSMAGPCIAEERKEQPNITMTRLLQSNESLRALCAKSRFSGFPAKEEWRARLSPSDVGGQAPTSGIPAYATLPPTLRFGGQVGGQAKSEQSLQRPIDCPEGIEFVSKLLKSLCHSKRSEESELETRLFAMLRVTSETFYTVSITS